MVLEKSTFFRWFSCPTNVKKPNTLTVNTFKFNQFTCKDAGSLGSPPRRCLWIVLLRHSLAFKCTRTSAGTEAIVSAYNWLGRVLHVTAAVIISVLALTACTSLASAGWLWAVPTRISSTWEAAPEVRIKSVILITSFSKTFTYVRTCFFAL